MPRKPPRRAAAGPQPQSQRHRRPLQVEPDGHLSDWEEWEASYKELDAGIDRYAALKGTLARGAERLLAAFRLSEELGQLAYRVWYFPSLRYDEDQRDNSVNARRQQVQILFAQVEAGGVVVQPRAARRFRSRPCAAWMDDNPDARGSTASRSRISTASRNTCSTRRASG